MVPTPSELAGPGRLAARLCRDFRCRIRPCSGRSVLVFAAGAGAVWAGRRRDLRDGARHAIHGGTIAVVAVSARGLAQRLSGASDGGGALIMRGVEFGAGSLCCCSVQASCSAIFAAERVTCL